MAKDTNNSFFPSGFNPVGGGSYESSTLITPGGSPAIVTPAENKSVSSTPTVSNNPVRPEQPDPKLEQPKESRGSIGDNILRSPFDGPAIITSNFAVMRTYPNIRTGSFPHGALDLIPAGASNKIYACATGKIIEVGYNSKNGNYIIFQTVNQANNFTYLGQGFNPGFSYLHLAFTPKFSVGQIIQIGDFVENMDNTGASSGPHLHLTVANYNLRTVIDYGVIQTPYFIDPEPLFAAHGITF